jgi:nitrogen fixation-related uncharacterized protein
MKKQIDVVAVLLFLVALAVFFAAAKVGHYPHGNGYGFFSGG